MKQKQFNSTFKFQFKFTLRDARLRDLVSEIAERERAREREMENTLCSNVNTRGFYLRDRGTEIVSAIR